MQYRSTKALFIFIFLPSPEMGDQNVTEYIFSTQIWFGNFKFILRIRLVWGEFFVLDVDRLNTIQMFFIFISLILETFIYN